MCLNKKVKGFTLVELLVTIGIIGIILTISTVSVYTIINNSKDNSNKVAIENMKKSAGVYVKEYENEVSWQEKNINEFEACIPLQTLIAKGYLKEDVLDNENIPLSIILIRDEYNNIISEVEERYDCGTYAKIVQIPTSNDICNNYTYDGNNHFLINPNIQMTDYKEIKYNDTTYKNTNNVLEHPKNAGEYKVSINLAPGKQWSDNTTNPKTVTCKINKKTPDLGLSSTGNSDTLENIGTREITLTSEVSGNITIKSSNKNYVTAQVVGSKNITANEEKIIKITTHSQRNSSTSITITVVPTGDYASNYKNGTVTYTVGNIKTITIDKPTSGICNNLTYNATEQKLAKTNEAYQLINNTAIEIGNYTITARLKYGYMWKDNTTDNVEINCQIKTPVPEVTYKDATCNPESIDVIYGKAYNEKQQLCIPVKIGYTFSGWYSDNSFTKKITNDTIVTNFNNHNLYAKWTPNKYIISFDANGGVVSPLFKEVTYDKTYGTLPDATRTGYTFDGWYTAVNGGTEVTASDKVNITSNITLYAHWTANKYIISFDGNGGVVSSTSKEVTYDKTYDTLPGATRTGYTFDGWYTAVNGGTKVTISDKVNITSNTNLYAHWEPNENTKYVVNHYRMDLDGINYTLHNVENLMGTTDSSVTPGTKNYTGFTAPQKQTVTILPDGSRVVNYYYSRNSYIITFNANGGSVTTSSKTIRYEGTYESLPDASRTGYKLVGWYTAASGGTKIESYNTFTNTSNQTLYAHWEATSYAATSSSSTYTATATCTNGRILSNGNCIYETTCEEDCIRWRCDTGCGMCYECGSEVCGCEDDGGKWIEYETTCDVSCTETQNQYRVYTCPRGGSLSETTCTIITYTCPNGGTLDGTTCVFR